MATKKKKAAISAAISTEKNKSEFRYYLQKLFGNSWMIVLGTNNLMVAKLCCDSMAFMARSGFVPLIPASRIWYDHEGEVIYPTEKETGTAAKLPEERREETDNEMCRRLTEECGVPYDECDDDYEEDS